MRYKLILNADGTSEWIDARLAPKKRERKVEKSVHVSDIAMCVLPEEVQVYEADAKLHGFNISWEPDRTSVEDDGTPNTYNPHIPLSELDRYRKHRGMSDQNSKNGSGAMLPQGHLDEAARRVREKYGVRQSK